jgi:putative transposase
MSELRKANTDHAYFITLTIVGWIDVFTRHEYCDEILKNLEYCRTHKGLKVHEYCIMSNHIHLIISRTNGSLSDLLRDFKSYTSKRVIELISDNLQESRKELMLHLFKFFAKSYKQNSEYMFWQKTSHPTELFTADVFDQKRDYIHQNPVTAMVVNDTTSYVYSSANPDSAFIVDES